MSRDIASTLATAQQKFTAGHYAEAEALLQQILALDPQHGEALEGLGYIAAKQGDHAGAAEYLLRAVQNMDASAEQLQLAAHVCQLAERHVDAAALYERSLVRAPDHAPSLHAAALSLAKIGEHQRALQYFERLTSRHPRLAEVHYNKGTLLGLLGRYDDEMAAYRQAIACKPDFVRAYVNLGVALRDQHRFDEALQQFKKALAIDANDAGARTNRAQTNLLLGEFEHGWREYEWRWRDGTDSHGFPAATLWTGTQPLAGKTVLVHHEQGFGDTLQFVRFTDRLSAAGARVILRVQDALLALLRDYPGVAEVIGASAPPPPFDYHIPLMSLAFALKVRAADLAVHASSSSTSAKSSAPHAYLHADPVRVAAWRELLGERTRRLRVGVVWSGSRTHLNDRNRSMPLALLDTLFAANTEFVSLQPDVRDDDRAYLAQLVEAGVMRDFTARLESFADTAALITQLDLVIAVDTAVAHLAAALGKPVWIALPFTPDWRWQMTRDDSPWYPGMRLFRQSVRGDWSNVVTELRAALDGFQAE
ncbi:tetratricopeptide repeat protein [Paraburkholderia sp. DHOC27]|uniref:tetratricopeptide repeat-containing glycosyltransferase family protein n=1 Tax=Paraburkholderia sp. DHOC27 TaxID=2303330 RepID=UPI000E3B5A73|nr:tetratricopeptide repeat-containing glycosyltransferase family protein [Paraburkholderia sp. DHOC27]RFU44117.1 tetratricopeptide repeat protein [Paraburkholderia sp. DHOC27]